MVAQNPIVISDSDSDTLSESERPTHQPALKAKLAPVNEQRPSNRSRAVGSPSLQEPSTLKQKTPEPGSSAAGLLGLLPNRRQLELERKERARKRRREQNLPSSSSDDDEVQSEPKRKRVATAHSDGKQALAAPETPASTSKHPAASYAQPVSRSDKEGSPSGRTTPPFSRATDPIEAESRFWTGTIKHGYNRYADGAKSGVTIPQMLLPATASSRSGLQLAVLATYDLRMDWLWSQFPRGLPVTLILPPPKEDYRTDSAVARPGLHPSEIFGDFSRCPGWQICVPTKPKGGWLTQHMKFFILVHDNFLRVAILSGNLNGIDWERIENTAYIHDFPLLSEAPKPSGTSSSPAGVNDFKSQLVRVLRSLSMPTSHPVYEALNLYDFSQATRARIVASWPEASSLADWDRIETQGLGRLGKVVRDFGVRPARQAPIELECQGSSLANHDVKWIEHFHLLASGVNPRGILPLKGKANETHLEYLRAVGSKVGSLPPVKVCFPSHRYVEERTVEGPLGALSFFGKAETFASSPIKKLYHSPQSRRGDIMIHAKSILALTAKGSAVVDKAFRDASDTYISGKSSKDLAPLPETGEWSPRETEQPVGWTYLGSSNFTRAAYGNISGSAAKPTMSTLNWELGVVLPIYASEVERFGVEAESLRPIVYHRPLQPYAPEDSPWDNSAGLAMR